MNILGDSVRDQALGTLNLAANELLSPIGFVKADSWEWIRERGWKAEHLVINVSRGFRCSVFPSCSVSFPRVGVAPFFIEVERLLYPDNGPTFDVAVPSVFFMVGGFVERVCGDIQRSFVWFDRYATPGLCKTRLNDYLKVESPAYCSALRYLDGILDTSV